MNSPERLRYRSSWLPSDDDDRIVEPEDAQEAIGDQEEQRADRDRHRQAHARGDVDGVRAAVWTPRAEVLPRDAAAAPIRPTDVHVISENNFGSSPPRRRPALRRCARAIR